MDESCDNPIQHRLDESMPWVGRYILAASAICTLAMAADAFNGFRLRKLWFPCKYFSLDAASLTVLAVAMKLPMDLTTIMIFRDADSAAKLTSMIFMSTAIGNFMTSLGSMNDEEVLPNVIALAILVFTIAADVVIQLILLWEILDGSLYVISATLMLLCLAALFSLGVAVPTAKRSLELRYQEKHKVALGEEEGERRGALRMDDERGYMMKYWVMAATSNPQFVIARSVASTMPAVLCLLAAVVLAVVYFESSMEFSDSPYGGSTRWILYVQTTGVALGSIAPLFRWLLAVSFKCSSSCWKTGFKIETYWSQTLVDWRDSFSPLHIRQGNYRKCLHNAKWFLLTFCIGLQISFVLLSKLLLFFSVLFMTPLFSCFKKFINKTRQEHNTKDLNLKNYVFLLEDEAELPDTILNNICREADKMIHAGKMKQPQYLLQLLRKFVNFDGVGQFDSSKVPSLHGSSKEPPNCWTLPLVTLTSIALALPNTTDEEGEHLLSSVDEGLSLAKLVDTKNSQLTANIREAADNCWVGVVLYMQWQEIDLRGMSPKFKDSKKVLEELCNKAEGIFKEEVKDAAMENPLYWPAKAVSANSMYRITRTILLSCEEEDEQTDEGMFEQLSVIIADILAACLTNLRHVITTMCHSNVAIEKRERSVGKAFLLLGETEQIVQLVQKQKWPCLDPDKATSIEEWRALFRQNEDDDHPSTKQTRVSTTTEYDKHLSIKVCS